MPVNFSPSFRVQYQASRKFLSDLRKFDPEWQPVVEQLAELMRDSGFDPDHALVLDDLRRRLRAGTAGAGRAKGPESEELLRAVLGWDPSSSSAPANDVRLRAGVLKMLRHVYLLNRSGNRKVWIHSLPKGFAHWSPVDLHGCGTPQDMARLLDAKTELFTNEQKRSLAVATHQAMAWSQRALMSLASATSSVKPGKPAAARDKARELLRRWFADPSTTEADLDRVAAELSLGFKHIVACLNRGEFVLTDWVPFRHSADADEQRWLQSQGFTFRQRAEGMDVVYIESAFFDPANVSVVSGQKKWTRCMLHEISHLAAGTVDVVAGFVRYAHDGIGPHAGFPCDKAVSNADSWTFFAADCAGVLSQGERALALRIA